MTADHPTTGQRRNVDESGSTVPAFDCAPIAAQEIVASVLSRLLVSSEGNRGARNAGRRQRM
jgi:hypothetical protein